MKRKLRCWRNEESGERGKESMGQVKRRNTKRTKIRICKRIIEGKGGGKLQSFTNQMSEL